MRKWLTNVPEADIDHWLARLTNTQQRPYVAEPQATEKWTVEQLQDMNMVGIWADMPDQVAPGK